LPGQSLAYARALMLTVEIGLTRYHAPFQRFFQRLLPLSPVKWGARTE
jgi:hypothetical protein